MTTSLDQETIVAISPSRVFESNESQSSAAGSFGRGTDEHRGQNALGGCHSISLEPSWPPAFQSESASPPDLLPRSSGLQALTASSCPLSSSITPTKITSASTTASPKLSTTTSALSPPSNDASTTASASTLSPPSDGVSTTATPQLSTATSTLSPPSNGASTTATPQLSTATLTLSPPSNGASTTAHLPLSGLSHLSSSSTTERAPAAPSAEEYFRDKVGSENSNRVKNLVRAVDGLIESQKLDLVALASVVEIWSRVCKECGGPITRLRCLSLALDKFDHHFTNLLGNIFFGHEVEHIVRSKNLDLSTGQKSANAAFIKVAKELGISVKDVKARYKRSKILTLLLAKDGPGTLLQLGIGVDSIWETKFTIEDVQILLEYRAKHLVHLKDQARTLDPCARQMLLNAMFAYGWSWDELANSRSGLAVCLQRHRNLDQLADMEDNFAITQSLRYSATGEDSGASDDRIQNKRRYGGPDNTGRSVKRVQRAEGIEELDISMMMQAHAADNLDITTIMQQAQVLGVDISTMMQAHAAGNLDITTTMQQALAFGQLDISMEMQLARNFGRNADIEGGVACAEVGETRYVGAGTTCADVRGLETFGDIATDAATPLPGYMLQTTTDAQQYMFPTYNTTSPSMSALMESLADASTE